MKPERRKSSQKGKYRQPTCSICGKRYRVPAKSRLPQKRLCPDCKKPSRYHSVVPHSGVLRAFVQAVWRAGTLEGLELSDLQHFERLYKHKYSSCGGNAVIAHIRPAKKGGTASRFNLVLIPDNGFNAGYGARWDGISGAGVNITAEEKRTFDTAFTRSTEKSVNPDYLRLSRALADRYDWYIPFLMQKPSHQWRSKKVGPGVQFRLERSSHLLAMITGFRLIKAIRPLSDRETTYLDSAVELSDFLSDHIIDSTGNEHADTYALLGCWLLHDATVETQTYQDYLGDDLYADYFLWDYMETLPDHILEYQRLRDERNRSYYWIRDSHQPQPGVKYAFESLPF